MSSPPKAKRPRGLNHNPNPAVVNSGLSPLAGSMTLDDSLNGQGYTQSYTPGAGFVQNPYGEPARVRTLPSPASSSAHAVINAAAVESEKPVSLEDALKAMPRIPKIAGASSGGAVQRAKSTSGRKRVIKVKIRGLNFETSNVLNNEKRMGTTPNRGITLTLNSLIANIKAINDNNVNATAGELAAVRETLNKLALNRNMDRVTLEKCNFVYKASELSASQYSGLPPDILDDLLVLAFKWNEGDLDADLLRGLQVYKHVDENDSSKSTQALKSEPDYRFGRNAAVAGSNNLAVGQWWPFQLCALRDGAVGTSQAGITTSYDSGAVAIIASAVYADDDDSGETLWYAGTEQNNAIATQPTSSTAAMITANTKRTPIRVLRSSKGRKASKNSKGSKYCPEKGLRYDGLYKIVKQEELNAAKHHWRFLLERLPDQSPMRWDGELARPNLQEKAALQDIVDRRKIYG